VSLLDQHVTATFVLDEHGRVAVWNKALEKEFVVILPTTEEAGVELVAENIRANIEKRAIHHPLSSVGHYVTVSIGRATVIPTTDDNIEKIVSLADMGLYQAKSLGRNRVCTFDDGRFGVLEKSVGRRPK
jgi:predicted signal transduction protein with EAL and GGDEF domain